MRKITLINDEIKIYDVNYEYRKYLYQYDKRVNTHLLSHSNIRLMLSA